MDKNIKDIVTMATLLLNTYATRKEVLDAVDKAVTLLETVRELNSYEILTALRLVDQRKSGVEDAA
tara:strand:+ start:230 stop:427 length:198 start_codon:yes stop_codon:yes gene_type:complete